jgi:hypothetical protein
MNIYKKHSNDNPLYRIWKSIRQKCQNPNNKTFKTFGAKGLYFYPEWEDFDVFSDWSLSNGYHDHLSLVRYDESKSYAQSLEWAQTYGTEEAIVLYSDFDVDASGGDGSLNPNSTYRNWQWVMTRNGGGAWVLQTWGYG